ncbi:MAG TPA: hypothetical protein VFI68_12930, partial [Anaerolineales bacterium]|nr:hypothetical protein [Anaerolineales bacterium]
LSILILTSVACGGSSPAPAPSDTGVLPAPTDSISLATQPVAAFTSQPTQIVAAAAIPETRRLTLEYPSRMRAGVEGDVVRLTLEVDELGNITPTAQFEGNVIVGETIEIPDLYETHNVTAEAQLDLAGMTVQPSGAIFEPLTRGRSATFFWSIRPQEPGKFRGTVWLHLNFTDKLTGEDPQGATQSRIAVSAQIVEIEAVDFFGLSVNLARTSGLIGSVVGGVIGFPFLEDIARFLFKRRKKK